MVDDWRQCWDGHEDEGEEGRDTGEEMRGNADIRGTTDHTHVTSADTREKQGGYSTHAHERHGAIEYTTSTPAHTWTKEDEAQWYEEAKAIIAIRHGPTDTPIPAIPCSKHEWRMIYACTGETYYECPWCYEQRNAVITPVSGR